MRLPRSFLARNDALIFKRIALLPTSGGRLGGASHLIVILSVSPLSSLMLAL